MVKKYDCIYIINYSKNLIMKIKLSNLMKTYLKKNKINFNV